MPTPFQDRILLPLNESQRKAVEQIDGPVLILAGPGSGKTRVITHRIAWMIHNGIDPHDIVALTFTNKAADEMRARLATLVPGAQVWAGTFHRFCARLLRVYASLAGIAENYTIYDMDDSRKLLKQAIESLEIDVQHYSPGTIGNRISAIKNNGQMPEQFQPAPGNYLDFIASQIYPVYQRLLQNANAADFDDLLLLSGNLLYENAELRAALDQRYTRMMVDEYQDTNIAQYRLIRMLNHDVRNLAVTGDPDQSIYGWRGASLANILNFEKDYPEVEVIRLEQNYRSVHPILHVADELIANNVKRKEKTLVPLRTGGEPVSLVAYPNPQHEADDIANSISLAIRSGRYKARDFAIFYRTNYLSRSLEHSLRARGIPYQILHGVEFYQRREIKDLIAWLHLLNNERDRIAFERVINVPPRRIGKATLDKLRGWSLDAPGRSLMDACRMSAGIESISRGIAVRLSAFLRIFDQIGETRHEDVGTILRAILAVTRYREWLIEDGSEEGHERANNVDELLAAADEFDRQHPDDGGLEAFLEQTALVSDTDAWEAESDFVTLLTIHSAKGLEFPCVFIVGLEDGILPHERSQASEDEVEEERRVLFVGITRAMEHLQLSRSLSRFRNGSSWPTIASRFLMELPRESMRIVEPRSIENVDLDELWADGSFDDSLPEPWDEIELQSVATAVDSEDKKPESPVGESGSQGRLPSMMTAAQLLKQQDAEGFRRYPLEKYRVGGRVDHPDYGKGVVTAISGTGIKRMATVDFGHDYGNRRFRLSHSNLRPLDE